MFRVCEDNNLNNIHYECANLKDAFKFLCLNDNPNYFTICEIKDNAIVEICTASYLLKRFHIDNLQNTLQNLYK